MKRSLPLLGAALLATMLACAPAEEPPMEGPQTPLEWAMAAAPLSLSEHATIMDAEMNVLREGTNGWTCIPDIPGTPVQDPVCSDQNFMGFLQAFMSGTEPNLTGIGIAYMFEGDAVGDNDDPFATEPPEGQDWLYNPAHLMISLPDPSAYEGYPTDPKNGGPWIMFANTPYVHLMVPTASVDHEEM